MKRYKVDVYSPKDRSALEELAKEDKNFKIPSPNYLKDLALCIWDIKKDKMVAFICAVVGKKSDIAYVSHLILTTSLRRKREGSHVLRMIFKYLEKGLSYLDKTAYEGFVNENNRAAYNLYIRRGGKVIDRGFLFRKEIKNV